MRAVGAEAEAANIQKLIGELKGKDVAEIIAAGTEKLASVSAAAPAAAAGAPAAAAPAAAAGKKEEKKKARFVWHLIPSWRSQVALAAAVLCELNLCVVFRA